MSKWIQLSRSKYRTLVSDILPYEKPIFFTNQYFARFVEFYGVRISEGRLVATKHCSPEVDDYLLFIGGTIECKRSPFHYGISKKEEKCGRTLTILHPYQQMQMVEFYDRYKMLLIEFCSRSNFSLRYPYKVATYKAKEKDISILWRTQNIKSKSDPYNIKHFFAYHRFGNINHFYDDYLYLRAEKRFPMMFRLDLHQCFEHINAQDLAKAIYGDYNQSATGDMASVFSALQKEYIPETAQKGIVIGPEFSRIFAEMILQRIDRETEIELESYDIKRTADYLFYRYVDDGFLFFSDLQVKERFMEVYTRNLTLYGQELNSEKEKFYDKRPFVNTLSRVKAGIKQLIIESFENRLENFKGFQHLQEGRIDAIVALDYKQFVQSYRNIVGSEEDVKYKDVMAFTVGLINEQMVKRMGDFNEVYKKYKKAESVDEIMPEGESVIRCFESGFIRFCSQLIEVLFFLLSCDLRMNTSIKVVASINRMQQFVRGSYLFEDGSRSCRFTQESICVLDEAISEEISKMLDSYHPNKHNLMELLNILELEKGMAKSCRTSPYRLNRFLEQTNREEWNFFVVFELLHLIKNDKIYNKIQNQLYEWILTKEQHVLSNQNIKYTEDILTIIETLGCPWVSQQLKEKITCDIFGEKNLEKMMHFIEKQRDLFVNWRNYNIESSMTLISNTEVY